MCLTLFCVVKDNGLLGLHDKLKTMTIRGINLYKLLWHLAFRDGIAHPLAITGGSVRDAIQGKLGVDIDIVVGGTFDEVHKYLRDILVSHGEAVTDNTLYVKKSFGQFKIMNIKVWRIYPHLFTMQWCVCVCEREREREKIKK